MIYDPLVISRSHINSIFHQWKKAKEPKDTPKKLENMDRKLKEENTGLGKNNIRVKELEIPKSVKHLNFCL